MSCAPIMHLYKRIAVKITALIKRGGGKRPCEARQPPCKAAGKVPIPAVIPRDEGILQCSQTPEMQGFFVTPRNVNLLYQSSKHYYDESWKRITNTQQR